MPRYLSAWMRYKYVSAALKSGRYKRPIEARRRQSGTKSRCCLKHHFVASGGVRGDIPGRGGERFQMSEILSAHLSKEKARDVLGLF